ncbi:hypothetical protein V5O48_012441 [Marasmius crinis-equi]|uniref:Uncharacterized protein n=1 Tax=Marasmius crinis-equi TaxID=585013 RepID=A0ABR3F3E1_9AGAR
MLSGKPIGDKLEKLVEQNPLDISILCPSGEPLVPNPSNPDDIEEDDTPIPAASNDSFEPSRILGGGFNPEVEDAAIEEIAGRETAHGSSAPSFDKFIMSKGEKINKGKALGQRLKYFTLPSSTDWLKRVHEAPHYNPTISTATIIKSGSGNHLVVSDTIVSVLRCEEHFFLSFGEIISLGLGAEVIEQISVGMLVEENVMVTYQLLALIPASSDDDQSLVHDWRSRRPTVPRTFKVQGRLVQAVNPKWVGPAVGGGHPGYFLFCSPDFIDLAATFTDIRQEGDAKDRHQSLVMSSPEETTKEYQLWYSFKLNKGLTVFEHPNNVSNMLHDQQEGGSAMKV